MPYSNLIVFIGSIMLPTLRLHVIFMLHCTDGIEIMIQNFDSNPLHAQLNLLLPCRDLVVTVHAYCSSGEPGAQSAPPPFPPHFEVIISSIVGLVSPPLGPCTAWELIGHIRPIRGSTYDFGFLCMQVCWPLWSNHWSFPIFLDFKCFEMATWFQHFRSAFFYETGRAKLYGHFGPR